MTICNVYLTSATREAEPGHIGIDAVDYASRGNAILGIRDSGKTYTATGFAEQLLAAGVPFVAFDPIGVWRFLRVPAEGVATGFGKGFPVVVAGGQAGDLPLTVANAAAIVRAAMVGGVSLVIDLFDVTLSKADWKRIVTSCLRTLLHENGNHGLRHVFIEEAAEFAPQRVGPDQGQVYAEMEKLARMGGNARLGFTLINQRAEEVNKAVLELCDNLFLHRQRGRNSLTALSRWLDVGNVARKTADQIRESLPNLPTGQCWVWLAGREDDVALAHVTQKRSMHPDRRAIAGTAKAKPAVDVSSFVAAMKQALEAAVEPVAIGPDVPSLQATIKTQAKEIERLKALPRGFDASDVASWGTDLRNMLAIVGSALHDADQRIIAMMDRAGAQKSPQIAQVTEERPPMTSSPAIVSSATSAAPAASAARSDLKPAQQRVLDAIAWWIGTGLDPVPRARVAVAAGLSPKASTTGVYLAQLVERGLVANAPGAVTLTERGRAIAAFVKPTVADLRAKAESLLSGREVEAFRFVYQQGGAEVGREAVSEAMGLSPIASTTGVYLSKVAAMGLIEGAGPGKVRAAPWLFL